LWEEPQGIEVGIDSETSCAVSKYFLNPWLASLVILEMLLLMPCTDDDNRVILEPIPGYMNCHHDYINASYIDVRIIYDTYKDMANINNDFDHNYRDTSNRENMLPCKVSWAIHYICSYTEHVIDIFTPLV
jgi:hypothetical protein